MIPSGFGENPSLGVPKNTHHGYYLSGWCGRCGRKRGADGRCSDCDGWWTSPLVATGGPVIGIGTLLLLCLVPLLNHATYRTTYATPQTTAVLAAPSTLLVSSPAHPFLAPPYAAPARVPAPPPSLPTPIVVPATPSPDQIALLEHQRLVQMADYAGAVVRANDRLRAAASVSRVGALPRAQDLRSATVTELP